MTEQAESLGKPNTLHEPATQNAPIQRNLSLVLLETSLLIADERGKFDMPGLLGQFPGAQPMIPAITASEFRHGVERAQDAARGARRQQHVEQILAAVSDAMFKACSR